MLWDRKTWKSCQNHQKKVRIRENEVQGVAVCDVPRPTGATKCVIFPQKTSVSDFSLPRQLQSAHLAHTTHFKLTASPEVQMVL